MHLNHIAPSLTRFSLLYKHFGTENLRHSLCCSPEQEETIARLNANIDLIRRSCPSCLINVKKLFCNLLCAPNQRDFIRVDRVKGETVVEVTYAVSEHFVNTFFSSCQDVRVFGAYLLDYEYGCGKMKRANCTAEEFMRVLGSLSEIPFNFRPLIVKSGKELPQPSNSLVSSTSETSGEVNKEEVEAIKVVRDEWPRAVMNDTAYECTQAPPSMSPCQCDHCPSMCTLKKQKLGRPALSPKLATTHQSTHKTATSASSSFSLADHPYSTLPLAVMYIFCLLAGRYSSG